LTVEKRKTLFRWLVTPVSEEKKKGRDKDFQCPICLQKKRNKGRGFSGT